MPKSNNLGTPSAVIRITKFRFFVLSLMLVLVGLVGPVRAQCCEWVSGFELAGVNDAVRALTEFDDGSGLALYAGGLFPTAGDVVANRIAKWDGVEWSALGNGMNNNVLALAVFDDALYAGGFFTSAGDVAANDIAKWNGEQWSAVGGGDGMNGSMRR